MTSKHVSFDDFLPEEPDTPISIKREKKEVIAPSCYKGKDYRDTAANWLAPSPEEVVLFWSHTTCQTCGSLYTHPTYEQNSLLVKYRVSKFRAILRPFSPALEEMCSSLPHVKCIIESKVQKCISCFESKIEYTELEWETYLEDNSPPAPAQPSDKPEKPISNVSFTDMEIASLMGGKK